MPSSQQTAAFFQAIKSGDLETVKTLLYIVDGVNAQGGRALWLASELGHTEIVKLLVNAGADVHADEDTALRWASANGHTKVVEFLLEAGANIHVYDDVSLLSASQYGHIKVVELLLHARTGSVVFTTSTMNAALWNAANFGHTEIVDILIQSGADIQSGANEAFRRASGNRHAKTAKFLLDAGADISARNHSVFYYAVFFRHTEIVEILVLHYLKLKQKTRLEGDQRNASLDHVFLTLQHRNIYIGYLASLVVEDPRLINLIETDETKHAACTELLKRENDAITFVAEQIQSRKNPLARYYLHVMASIFCETQMLIEGFIFKN